MIRTRKPDVLWALLLLSGCMHESRVPPKATVQQTTQQNVQRDVSAESTPPPSAPEPAAPMAPSAAAPSADKREELGAPVAERSHEAASGYDPTSRLGALMGSGLVAEGQGSGYGGLDLRGTGRGGGGGRDGVRARPAGKAAVGAAVQPAAPPSDFSREEYARIVDHDFQNVSQEPLSTFSIDVDTASYSNVRRFLRDGQLPPADAVRIEELINYFDYDYPEAPPNQPFSTYVELGPCPWNQSHRLVHVGIAGKRVHQERVPTRNLVFLIDVSGSMQDANKLPLLQQGMSLLVNNLRPQDRVSLVVYAGSSGLVLPSTSGTQREVIREALTRLSAGGSTNGAEGIQLAYQEAQRNFVKGGINRVILATDGDFNVGVTSEGELTRLIEEKRKSGVFLTVLGFGTGNLQDHRMEQLADKGNGNYAYIDDLAEAEKVLVREAGATLVTIAKDVKLQVEFNPQQVKSYRLVGYENRALAAKDFNDDKKDAGEIGAGHEVTALYEIVPAHLAENAVPAVDPLRYQGGRLPTASHADELLTVKIRYKAPDSEVSSLISVPYVPPARSSGMDALKASSESFRFSAAVAEFGMLLRKSPHKGSANLQQIQQLAEGSAQRDPHGDKAQFLDLVKAASRLGVGG